MWKINTKQIDLFELNLIRSLFISFTGFIGIDYPSHLNHFYYETNVTKVNMRSIFTINYLYALQKFLIELIVYFHQN